MRDEKGRYLVGNKPYPIIASAEKAVESVAENEQWKPCKGYKGFYWVSNYGRVKSARRLLTPFKGKAGYLSVTLRKGEGKNIHKTISVHRLVASAFVDNPSPEKFNVVNHKDANRCNNNSDNLEWCDSQYNNLYRYRGKT